jgi:uncharacterized protein (TIGR02265 family)
MEPRIGGNVIFARRAYVLEQGGEALWNRVLARLPPADAEALKKVVLVTSAYPLALNTRLDQAIAATLSPDDPERVFLEMGRSSADANLRGPQKAFVHPGDPHFLLGMADMIYAYYYSVGRRTYQQTGPTSGVLTTFDAAPATPGDCLTIVAWHQRAIELSGGLEASVIETKCRHRGDDVCEYACSWKV